MTELEFIEKFSEAIDLDDCSGLTLETKFRELDEWSSLTGLSTIEMMGELTGSSFSVENIKSCNSIGDLYHFLSK